MYVCLYVHADVCACEILCVCTRVRMYASVRASERASVRACVRACLSACVRASEYVCARGCQCLSVHPFFPLGARRFLCEFNAAQRLCSCLYACVRVCGCARGRCYASTMFDAHLASSFVEVHTDRTC